MHSHLPHRYLYIVYLAFYQVPLQSFSPSPGPEGENQHSGGTLSFSTLPCSATAAAWYYGLSPGSYNCHRASVYPILSDDDVVVQTIRHSLARAMPGRHAPLTCPQLYVKVSASIFSGWSPRHIFSLFSSDSFQHGDTCSHSYLCVILYIV